MGASPERYPRGRSCPRLPPPGAPPLLWPKRRSRPSGCARGTASRTHDCQPVRRRSGCQIAGGGIGLRAIIGIGIALLIGGVVVTESVFAIPGLGRLTIDAIVRRDYPLIQGLVVVFSFVYVLVNLCVDVIYTIVDPRIRY